MGQLLQRLEDASKSGVYRMPRARDPRGLVDAAAGAGLRAVQVDLAGAKGKDAALAALARALAFPAWFGGNWDALEDCLADLSWMPAKGYVLVIAGAGGLGADDRGVLLDILSSVAASWAERGRPFFAVFADGAPQLPALFRDAG